MKSNAIQTQLSVSSPLLNSSLSKELNEDMSEIRSYPKLDEENILIFESSVNYFECRLKKFKEIKEKSLKEFQIEKPLLNKMQKVLFTKRNLWFKEEILKCEQCLQSARDLIAKTEEILGFF